MMDDRQPDNGRPELDEMLGSWEPATVQRVPRSRKWLGFLVLLLIAGGGGGGLAQGQL